MKRRPKVVTRQQALDRKAEALGFVRHHKWRWYAREYDHKLRLERTSTQPGARWTAYRFNEHNVLQWESPTFDTIEAATVYAHTCDWGQA